MALGRPGLAEVAELGESRGLPWGDLVRIFIAVYAVGVLATLTPAIRASRIARPETLRYE